VYYLTVTLTILSSIFFNVCLKVTPANVNPLIFLSVSYLLASMVTFALYPLYPAEKALTLWSNLRALNWTSLAVAFALVGMEMGSLLSYRAGWNISLFHVVASTAVTVLLVPIGLLFFKESLTGTTIVGLLLCVIGLILINYKA
jgi:drug/metabolite transporter (DMT)-like permease